MKTFKERLVPLFGLLAAVIPTIAFLIMGTPYSVPILVLTVSYGLHMGGNKKFPEWGQWAWFIGESIASPLLVFRNSRPFSG